MTASKARRAGGVPDDFNSEWLDEMVKKLFKTLESQLERVASARPAAKTAQGRAADARTLSSLERTLERLAGLERERARLREKKVAKHDPSARTALERRLDKLLAAATAQKPAGKTERG